MEKNERLEIIKKQPIFWSRLGAPHDPPIKNEQGKQVMVEYDYSTCRRYHDDFSKAGVKIHTTILHSGWVGDDKYDYRVTDRSLDELLKNNSDWYIPRIILNAPLDWCRNNPAEVTVFYPGPRSEDEIKTLLKDWTWGFYGIPEEKTIGPQSFSSPKWLKDAGIALKKLIERLENGPYINQILGYQIGFGGCGEDMTWDIYSPLGSVYRGDYGINNRRLFYDWAVKRYGSPLAVSEAWDIKNLTRENCDLPSPDHLERRKESLSDFFLADQKSQIVLDYNAFSTKVTADALEHFGKIIKQVSSDKPVGIFYCYIRNPHSAHCGCLAFDQLLESPYIDFFAAPKDYHNCKAGKPGGTQGPTRSVSRKKIWIDELDNRTHHTYIESPEHVEELLSHDMNDTRTVYWRETSKVLSYDQNFWWMDLGGGWHDDPDIMNEFRRLSELISKIREKKHHSISEILLVIDEKSIMHMSASSGISDGLIDKLEVEMKLIGVPVDLFRLADLQEMDISQYKVIVFLNAFLMTDEQWNRIKVKLPKAVTLIWNYAAGILSPALSLENVFDLTGFKIKNHLESEADKKAGYDIDIDFPMIEVEDNKQVETIDLYPDGGIMNAKLLRPDGGLSIFSAFPSLKTKALRNIALDSGCHMYAPENCTVYADNRFISVFSKGDIVGTLQLKEPHRVTEVIEGRVYEEIQSIKMMLLDHGAAFFLYED